MANVNTTTPNNTVYLIQKNGNKRLTHIDHLPDTADKYTHEYLGETQDGFAVIGERENRVTKKGALEAFIGLFF